MPVLPTDNCVPGTGLSASHTQSQLNLTSSPGGRDTFYPYSTAKESKTRGRDITCPGTHSREVAELAFNLGLVSDTIEFIISTTPQSHFIGEEMDTS